MLCSFPITDVTASGSEHSTLGASVKEAAGRLHFDISPDPRPDMVIFIRSDQYSFVKEGIPAVFLSTGFKSMDPKIKPGEILQTWMQTLYHQPQDDMSQPFDFESGTKFARYGYLVGYVVASKDDRPAWNRGDFFGEHYGKNH
ncbi:MAG TPA: M28 family peptidase [Candidatus Sulfotelmatobacter sp.]